MKKLQSILVIMLMAVIPMVFVACEGDVSEKNYSKKIVGKWQCIATEYEWEEGTDKESDYADMTIAKWIWEFDKDGKLNVSYSGEDSETYTYKIDGKKLYSDYAAELRGMGLTYFDITEFESKELTLEMSYDIDGVKARFVYYLKKAK